LLELVVLRGLLSLLFHDWLQYSRWAVDADRWEVLKPVFPINPAVLRLKFLLVNVFALPFDVLKQFPFRRIRAVVVRVLHFPSEGVDKAELYVVLLLLLVLVGLALFQPLFLHFLRFFYSPFGLDFELLGDLREVQNDLVQIRLSEHAYHAELLGLDVRNPPLMHKYGDFSEVAPFRQRL